MYILQELYTKDPEGCVMAILGQTVNGIGAMMLLKGSLCPRDTNWMKDHLMVKLMDAVKEFTNEYISTILPGTNDRNSSDASVHSKGS